jgi:hypothetical protein
MIEKIIVRGEDKVTEVRSDGGKLLYIKTAEGYEMKCPRTKQICLIRYEDMLGDCLRCLGEPAPVAAALSGKIAAGVSFDSSSCGDNPISVCRHFTNN